jgi:hypothetical protein
MDMARRQMIFLVTEEAQKHTGSYRCTLSDDEIIDIWNNAADDLAPLRVEIKNAVDAQLAMNKWPWTLKRAIAVNLAFRAFLACECIDDIVKGEPEASKLRNRLEKEFSTADELFRFFLIDLITRVSKPFLAQTLRKFKRAWSIWVDEDRDSERLVFPDFEEE